jgi:ABC-type sugar transport system ATPase subunit
VSEPALVAIRGLSKSYPGVRALRDVDLTVRAGEVHALVGENGAGKSTLIKILTGAERRDEGTIEWNGEPVALASPQAAQDSGISVIYQDVQLIPGLSAAENLLLGRAQPRRLGIFVDWPSVRARAREAAALVGADFDTRRPVRDLPHAQQVLTALARALSANARLIIMDEPTAALGAAETERLHAVIRMLSERGTTVLYVSHRLDEVLSLADTVTVLKDGANVGEFARAEITDTAHLTELIIGRSLDSARREPSLGEAGETLVSVRGVSYGNRLHDVSLELRAGEILGLAGLVGSGRSELAHIIFGSVRPSTGDILLRGKSLGRSSPAKAARNGIALLPEDRRLQATVPNMSVRENATLATLGRYRRGPFLSRRLERKAVRELVTRFQIKVAGIENPIRQLSGGNQQKVIVSRWVSRDPGVLLFDEPTQGIDVGAKTEIFSIMRDLADGGRAVLFISSEVEELAEVADRVIVLREGRVAAELAREEISTQAILRACFATPTAAVSG